MHHIAAHLDHARQRRQVIDLGEAGRVASDDYPGLDSDWGYATQAVDGGPRLAAGERLVGAELGLSSIATQQRMGVDRHIVEGQPVCAVL